MTTPFLLWYIENKKARQVDEIAAACDRFRAKHGQQPGRVYVNMGQYDESVQVDGLDICGCATTLRNHIEVWPSPRQD